jgi:hypothetical protein
MDATTYLEQRLDEQMQWHSAKSRVYQQRYKIIQLAVITAGALVPVFSASAATDAPVMVPHLYLLVSALGVLVAVLSAAQSLFRYQEMWIQYRATAEALKANRYLYLTGTTPYDGDDRDAVLVQRVEAIIADQNVSWRTRGQAGAATGIPSWDSTRPGLPN